MSDLAVSHLVVNLLVVLAAGFVSGVVCRWFGVSLLVGYLIVGAMIGSGGLRLVAQGEHELEYLARAGALLLLFSVGIEFSLDEFFRLRRFLFSGGSVQMLLVAVPLALVCRVLGATWQAAVLLAAAAALSSTILVFKTLAEWGQTASAAGRRAIAVLLFQDIALVPLTLLVPLLTGAGEAPTLADFGVLVIKSVWFLAMVVVVRYLISRWFVPLLAELKSVELIVLFALSLLGGACITSNFIGFPPTVGALAAGLMLSGNRLSKQVDSIVLPFRESFAAVFFVALGTLLDVRTFLHEPVLMSLGLVGVLLIKTVAAGFALKLTGLSWRASAGMGLGLAQLGEFSFLLLAEGASHGVITVSDYNRVLLIATGSLIITPQLLKFGLRWTEEATVEPHVVPAPWANRIEPVHRAILIGLGPIGRQIASRLELMGVDVCLVDLSQINLHGFAQQGFHTVTGDACDPEVLRRADVEHARLAVICVPDDDDALQIVRLVRQQNRSVPIVVRCRYQINVAAAKTAGAAAVVSEESEASGALIRLCESVVHPADETRQGD